MQHSSNLILGGLKIPFDDRQDAFPIERSDFRFRFAYRQIPIAVRCRTAADGALVEIEGDVGPLPFSAESSLARAELQTVLDAANGHLGQIFHVDGGQIRLRSTTTLALPITAAGLITAIVRLLIRCRPYLETIEVFLLPPGEVRRSGDAALRPGWRKTAAVRPAR